MKKNQLIKKLDNVFSKRIREKYSIDGICACYTCGCKKPIKEMQNGHFISRSCYLLRRDPENCRVQCVGCNVMKHGNYIEYTNRMINEIGQEKVNELIEKKNQLKNRKTYELEEMITYYSHNDTKTKNPPTSRE